MTSSSAAWRERSIGFALLLRERRPGILIIDSFKALAAYADSHRDFRSFLYQLAADTGAVAGSSFWLGEYDLDTITGEPEFAVADSILGLGSQRNSERSSRVLEVLKLRGSDYLSGQHSYRISAAGLSVFPRLADTVDSSSYDLARRTAVHRSSTRSMRCSPTATGPARRRCAPGPRASERR